MCSLSHPITLVHRQYRGPCESCVPSSAAINVIVAWLPEYTVAQALSGIVRFFEIRKSDRLQSFKLSLKTPEVAIGRVYRLFRKRIQMPEPKLPSVLAIQHSTPASPRANTLPSSRNSSHGWILRKTSISRSGVRLFPSPSANHERTGVGVCRLAHMHSSKLKQRLLLHFLGSALVKNSMYSLYRC
jgi:hypothetical protein